MNMQNIEAESINVSFYSEMGVCELAAQMCGQIFTMSLESV